MRKTMKNKVNKKEKEEATTRLKVMASWTTMKEKAKAKSQP